MKLTDKLNKIGSVRGNKSRIQAIRGRRIEHCTRDFDRLIGLSMEMEMIFDGLGYDVTVQRKERTLYISDLSS